MQSQRIRCVGFGRRRYALSKAGWTDGRTDEVKKNPEQKEPGAIFAYVPRFSFFSSQPQQTAQANSTPCLSRRDEPTHKTNTVHTGDTYAVLCTQSKARQAPGYPQCIASSLCLEHLQHCVRVCIFEHDVIRHRSVALRIPAHNKHQQSKIHFQHKQAR